ncbi:MAG: N-acetylmuramoyl-L-alanine amidase [Terrisporobacter sp.]
MRTYNVHGGHDAQGQGASGACALITNVGWFYESIEDRNVKNDVIDLFRKNNNTTYDCTVDDAGTQNGNLSQIIAKCNAHNVDLDISIHFNSGRDDEDGDGDNAGVEVWLYDDSDPELVAAAERVCKNMSCLGFDNRGVKYNRNYYVLRKTKAKAMIIECCFVDDKDDVMLYKKVGHRAVAKAIVEAILNKSISDNQTTPAGGFKYENGDYDRKAQVVGTGDGFLTVRTGRGTSFSEKGRLLEGQIITVNYCKYNWFSTYDLDGLGFVSATCIKLL